MGTPFSGQEGREAASRCYASRETPVNAAVAVAPQGLQSHGACHRGKELWTYTKQNFAKIAERLLRLP
jgi:hypothetical protein